MGGRRRILCIVALACLVAVPVLAPTSPASAAPSLGLHVQVSGANATGSATTPGLPCTSGGEGSYRHQSVEAPLAPGVFSSLAGVVRATLDVHHVDTSPVTGAPAFLLADESHATLGNARGTLRLALGGGHCATPNLTFTSSSNVGGGGTATVERGTGAYRDATLTGGHYTVQSELHPGADNAWALDVTGTIDVLQPNLGAQVVRAYWGNLGLDYLLRRVTVVYRLTNTGPGDSYGAALTSTGSSTAGVTPLGPTPQALGDLLAGEATEVAVRYQLGLIGPCALVLLGCNFASTVGVSMPDALDVPTARSATANVHAPDLPPPL